MLRSIFEKGRKLKETIGLLIIDVDSNGSKVLLSPGIGIAKNAKFKSEDYFQEFDKFIEDIEDNIIRYNWDVKEEYKELDEDELYEFYCRPNSYPVTIDGVTINRIYSEKDAYYNISEMEEHLNSGIKIGEIKLGKIRASIEIDGTIVIRKGSEIKSKFQVPLDQVEDETFFERVIKMMRGKDF